MYNKHIKGLVPEIYKAGDSDKIADIHTAIVSANETAMKIWTYILYFHR